MPFICHYHPLVQDFDPNKANLFWPISDRIIGVPLYHFRYWEATKNLANKTCYRTPTLALGNLQQKARNLRGPFRGLFGLLLSVP